MFCVTSNCANANLSGVKPVRREVDHNQGSKGACCNDGSSYSNSEDSVKEQRNQVQEQRLFLSLAACFFSAFTSNRICVLDGAASSLLNFETDHSEKTT